MLPFTINIIPLILSIATGFGVLFHDTKIDRAFASTPVSGYVSSEPSLRGDDHIHTENIIESIGRANTSQTGLNTRFTDEKKYLTPKKIFLNTTFDGLT